jgi:hypothetical protein
VNASSSTALASAIAVAVALSACGGAKALSKPEFIRQWDAICAKDDQKVAVVYKDLPDQITQDTLPQFAQAVGRVLPIARQEVKDLRNVKPPEADKTTINAILNDLDQDIRALDTGQRAAASGDLDAFNTAGQASSEIEGRANKAAQAYGFKDCGKG